MIILIVTDRYWFFRPDIFLFFFLVGQPFLMFSWRNRLDRMLHSWLRMMLKHRRDRNDRRDCLFIDVEDKIQPYTTRNHQCGYFDLTCTKCQLLCCSLLHHCHWDLPPLRQLMVSWSSNTNYHLFINKFVSLSFFFFLSQIFYSFLVDSAFYRARELLGQHHSQSFPVHPVCFWVHKIAISFCPAAP